MENYPDPTAFEKRYNLIATTNDFQPPKYLKQICRFCGLAEPEGTFKKIAHVVPELLGENEFICYDECDLCNSRFSKFESHLAIFFRPNLTTLGIKGKNKVQIFQSRSDGDEKNRTIFKHTDRGSKQLIIGDLDDYEIDKANKTMSLRFRMPPYKPLYVYISLIKIALSILPKENIERYRDVFDWISGKGKELPFLPFAYITILTRKMFPKPFVELYETSLPLIKNTFSPEITMVLRFANVCVQVFLPLTSENESFARNGGKATPELYPAYLYNVDPDKLESISDIDFKYSIVDLSSSDSKKEDNKMYFSFDDALFNQDTDSI